MKARVIQKNCNGFQKQGIREVNETAKCGSFQKAPTTSKDLVRFYTKDLLLVRPSSWSSEAMSIGVPVKLLHEAESHVVTIELKSGELYRGTLHEAEDNMNVHLTNKGTELIYTDRYGKII